METTKLPHPPMKPLAPPPPATKPPAPNGLRPTPVKGKHSINVGLKTDVQKVVLFSSGGAGKTSLAAAIQQVGIKPLFLDLEQGSRHCDVARIDTIETWEDLRGILHDYELLEPYGAIIIDSLTRAEEMAATWTCANVMHEKGHQVKSIEGYGFGKGMTHVYETFLCLLGDLDALARRGKHIICTAHECVASVPNPAGEDWSRYEPRLQSPASGKSSIRHRTKEWADHMLYIGFDVFVNEDGKAQGGGTRTIFPTEMPTHLAKSRSLADPIAYTKGSADLWKLLLKGAK